MLNETLEIIHLKNPSLYISQVQYMAPTTTTTPRNKLRHPLITAESLRSFTLGVFGYYIFFPHLLASLKSRRT